MCCLLSNGQESLGGLYAAVQKVLEPLLLVVAGDDASATMRLTVSAHQHHRLDLCTQCRILTRVAVVQQCFALAGSCAWQTATGVQSEPAHQPAAALDA